MGSSIFADESGDDSAREGRTDDGRRSVFRRRDDGDGDEQLADDDDAASGGGTMTVFSGDEVFEIGVGNE